MRKSLAFMAALMLAAQSGSAFSEMTNDASGSAWAEAQAQALTQLKESDGWQTLPEGLRLRRIKGDGSGKHPTVADVITLHYSGKLTDGTEFDSSYARGEPATFPLGRLIQAWQIAVPTMGVGDVIEIAVPAELGYGARGAGPIPGGATLFFTIELLGVQSR